MNLNYNLFFRRLSTASYIRKDDVVAAAQSLRTDANLEGIVHAVDTSSLGKDVMYISTDKYSASNSSAIHRNGNYRSTEDPSLYHILSQRLCDIVVLYRYGL